MAKGEHPRLILRSLLSSSLCKELEFIHKSNSTVGYRPSVFSTTLSHLIATNSAHFIIPFIPIRERLKEIVEECFGYEYELFIEFTGLISWCRGASIGWHSDDNRPYLKQRNFAVVCYLNSHGTDFKGGLFHFQDGDPATIVPMAGDALIYTADSRNIHSVDEITDGERLTLTLWFTLDRSHDEDAKLIALLDQRLVSHERPDSWLPFPASRPDSWLPFPASGNMYWFPTDSASHDQSGFDIRWARINVLGYNLYTSDERMCGSMFDSSSNPVELFSGPLKLAREDGIFEKEFVNSLHVLQVVKFYCWKASELQETKGRREANDVANLMQPLPERGFISGGSHQLAEMIFSRLSGNNDDMRPAFDWVDFAAAVLMWEDYVHRLLKELMASIPYWLAQQSIYAITLDDN